jgi:oligopeptide/dipeptide ABC transporter ATP-binding protein
VSVVQVSETLGAPSSNGASHPLLEIHGLEVAFRSSRRRELVRAVDGVDLEIGSTETLGLVGESGSGKSTIGRAILGLTSVTRGDIHFQGTDITRLRSRQRRKLGADLQVVFQDPYSSLNPTRTIGQSLAETLAVQGGLDRGEIDARVAEMLRKVGLPSEVAKRYPAQFSGGQRQRVAIARALMVGPRLVICDEAVSALDLSVQAQVLNLLRDLQREFELSYLFIAHDLSVVRHVSHRIAVLYRGRVMEQGEASTVYDEPAHPYTRALLQAAPVPDPDKQAKRRNRRLVLRNTEASESISDEACPFWPRCPSAIDICKSRRPQLEVTPEGSLVACHRWWELRPKSIAVRRMSFGEVQTHES